MPTTSNTPRNFAKETAHFQYKNLSFNGQIPNDCCSPNCITLNSKPTRNFVKEASQFQYKRPSFKKQIPAECCIPKYCVKCKSTVKSPPIKPKPKNYTCKPIKDFHLYKIDDFHLPKGIWKIYPIVWPEEELARIRQASHVVTNEEICQRKFVWEAEKHRQEIECEQRKRHLRQFDKWLAHCKC